VADRVVFLRPDAERIARAVRTVEVGNRNETPLTFRRVLEGRGGGGLRYVEWEGPWQVSDTNTITFKSNDSTATGINVFAGVDSGSGWVAKHDGTWHLVVCNLATQPEYKADQVQMLGHDDSGILRWYTTVECEDEEEDEEPEE
jgi:hypothetical protein